MLARKSGRYGSFTEKYFPHYGRNFVPGHHTTTSHSMRRPVGHDALVVRTQPAYSRRTRGTGTTPGRPAPRSTTGSAFGIVRIAWRVVASQSLISPPRPAVSSVCPSPVKAMAERNLLPPLLTVVMVLQIP